MTGLPWRDHMLTTGRRGQMIQTKVDALARDEVICDTCGYDHATARQCDTGHAPTYTN